MNLSENNIKLIFGLKLKQLRQEKGLTLSELAERSSLSVSYLNEIENGKKQPKPKKIAAIAKALDVPYDKLVSLKLNKNLAPISELLESNFLEKLPLDHYGIDVHKLLIQLSQAPIQLSALVSTLIEVAKSLELTENQFSNIAIRTYKELNENYFSELEDSVLKFCKKIKFDYNPPVTYNRLLEILTNNFNYEVDENSIPDTPDFSNIRAVSVINGKRKKILINRKLADSQKAFIIGKEIAYVFLKISDRSNLYSNIPLDSFDQLLNNLKASYFSTALIINKQSIINDISFLFNQKKFDEKFLLSLIKKYDVSPDMLLQRITNVLTKYFNISNFFFLRINSAKNSGVYSVTKQIRLNIKDYPSEYQNNEHYCRRWLSIDILKRLEELQKTNEDFKLPIAAIQKSVFGDSNNVYIEISIAKFSSLHPNFNYSVTLGFLLNEELKQKILFVNNQSIPERVVNGTCQRCNILDCKERAAKPTIYETKRQLEKLKKELNKIVQES
ncbi:helix-turn-helix domain-containing protein [Melioribacteraceae bacterium 4301-Me]|uniref:helix-turn-helix domain-containing protein n=1 Tax=Pyranulibacter aquaticus TaxID=3163344 RepID=UPI0035997432